MRSPKVMVIDDDPFDQALIRSAFRRVGSDADVDLVPEIAIAIRLLQTRRAPDLLIVDLNLGFETGIELIEWVRQEEALRCLPAIVMSGSDDPADITAAYRVGANAYVTKPQSAEDLYALVAALDAFWLQAARLPPAQVAPVLTG
ncbi:MAG: response regulator [Actinomycetota bacterium]